MSRHQSSLRGRVTRWLPRVVLFLAVVTASVGSTALPSQADARMPVSIEPASTPVYSGDAVVFNAFVSCSIPGGCTNAKLHFTAPAGASGPGAVAQPAPPGVSSVVANPDGSMDVTFSSVAVGTTVQLDVSWPTENYFTPPGPQTATVSGTTASGTGPTTASATVDLLAAPNLLITKTGPATVEPGAAFTYTVNASNQPAGGRPRGGLALDGATLTDPLPAGLTYVSSSNGGSYDASTNTVNWAVDTDPTRGGNQFAGLRSFTVTVMVPVTSPAVGTTFVNNATIAGTPFGTNLPPVSAVGSATTTVGPATGAPRAQLTKDGSDSISDGATAAYTVGLRNSGDGPGTGQIVDTLPAGLDLRSLSVARTTGSGPIPALTVHASYSDGTTRDFTGAAAGQSLDPSKTGARVTTIKVDLPALAPGDVWALQLQANVNFADMAPPGSPGATLTNCADGTLTATSGTTSSSHACHDSTLAGPEVVMSTTKTTSQVPVNPGGVLIWDIGITNDPDGLGLAAGRPELIDLLPAELDFVSGSWALEPGQPAACPAASSFDVAVSPTYQNGRVALIATAQPGATIAGAATCHYSFTTRVKSGTPRGIYTGDSTKPTYAGNWSYLFDADGRMVSHFIYNVPDVDDLNRDGSTTDRVAVAAEDFAVADSSAALVDKQVEGDQDAAFVGSAEVPGQEALTGHSTIGGTVSYKVDLGNLGNRPITHLVAYDLLPDLGVHGVTDGRYGDTAKYQFRPTLTGPIDAGTAPVTISYSTKADPCRPEMDATKGTAPFWCGGQLDPSFVPAASVTDWSAVKSVRFDFGDHVFQGADQFPITFTMAVPKTGTDGAHLKGGEQTWNKIAVQGDRLDTDGTTQPLLPAEAPWVVDTLATPSPVIHIEKEDAAGNDADTTATTVSVPAGTTTKLVFTVSNDGDEPLQDVAVTDAVTAGTATVSGLSCTFPDGSKGTTWAGPLNVGAGFPCTATLSAVPSGTSHTDDATVNGTGVLSGTPVTDDDPYNATSPPVPSVTVVKKDAAGNDANTASSSVAVPAGTTTDLVFTITNDGSEPLSAVTVTDTVTQGSATVSGLSCTFPDNSMGTTWAGPFAVGASFGCTAKLSAIAAGTSHTDVATVDGTGVYSGTPVTHDDEYHAHTPPPTTTTTTTTTTTVPATTSTTTAPTTTSTTTAPPSTTSTSVPPSTSTTTTSPASTTTVPASTSTTAPDTVSTLPPSVVTTTTAPPVVATPTGSTTGSTPSDLASTGLAVGRWVFLGGVLVMTGWVLLVSTRRRRAR